jgi:hypothetical protein
MPFRSDAMASSTGSSDELVVASRQVVAIESCSADEWRQPKLGHEDRTGQ